MFLVPRSILLTLTPRRVIPIVLVLFVGWKFFHKTSFVDLNEVPLRQILDHIDEFPEQREEPKSGPLKIFSWMWN